MDDVEYLRWRLALPRRFYPGSAQGHLFPYQWLECDEEPSVTELLQIEGDVMPDLQSAVDRLAEVDHLHSSRLEGSQDQDQ